MCQTFERAKIRPSGTSTAKKKPMFTEGSRSAEKISILQYGNTANVVKPVGRAWRRSQSTSRVVGNYCWTSVFTTVAAVDFPSAYPTWTFNGARDDFAVRYGTDSVCFDFQHAEHVNGRLHNTVAGSRLSHRRNYRAMETTFSSSDNGRAPGPGDTRGVVEKQ